MEPVRMQNEATNEVLRLRTVCRDNREAAGNEPQRGDV